MIPLWADLSRAAFDAMDPDTIAVLPLGATEQHGPHLPYGVDTDLTCAVLARVETQARAVQLPVLSITKSDEHGAVPGTLSLSAETMLAVLREVVTGVAAAGVQRLVFFNGHGGNTALLEIAVRAARRDHGMIAAHTGWFAFADHTGIARPAHDLHAGQIETSAMRAVRPDLVDMALAQDFAPALQDWEAAGRLTGLTGQPARPGWVIGDLHPAGAVGNAAAATKALGQQLIDSAAAGFGRWLEDFATFEMGA
ncbi:MAG: creatininase family protein [Pseudomonadota bacterium]